MPDTLDHPPFEAYNGNEPFIFASYSHKDSSAVFPELYRLHMARYRIWYDEGIDPGNEWPDEVAKALSESAFFLVFVSANAVESRNVRNEINFALNKGKMFLAVHMTKTALPVGLELRMGDIQAILKYQMDTMSYERKLDKALPEITRRDLADTRSEDLADTRSDPRRNIIEQLAEAAHEVYRQAMFADGWSYGSKYNTESRQKPFLAPYSDLTEDYKEANRSHVRAIPELLDKAGYYLTFSMSGSSMDEPPEDFSERMGRAEHDRWVAAMAAANWRWGPVYDYSNRCLPRMLPWQKGKLDAYIDFADRVGIEELPEMEKQKDRAAALQSLSILSQAGFSVKKKDN